jgi:hypothetical protein
MPTQQGRFPRPGRRAGAAVGDHARQRRVLFVGTPARPTRSARRARGHAELLDFPGSPPRSLMSAGAAPLRQRLRGRRALRRGGENTAFRGEVATATLRRGMRRSASPAPPTGIRWLPLAVRSCLRTVVVGSRRPVMRHRGGPGDFMRRARESAARSTWGCLIPAASGAPPRRPDKRLWQCWETRSVQPEVPRPYGDWLLRRVKSQLGTPKPP